MSEVTQTVEDTAAPARPLPGGSMALFLLFVVGSINYLDRQVLAVLVEPIKAELGFTDTQMGFLTGFAFALFYGVVGVPAAMLADRTHRVRLVAVACTLWSLCTGACGFAMNFWQLALARFGVGVGDAGGTAPSLSVLADYYPPRWRPLVTGIFTVNGPVGAFLGITLGGIAAAHWGWRGAFMGISLIGIVAAVILALVVREPKRGQLDPVAAAGAPKVGLLTTLKMFASHPTLFLLVIASGLAAGVSTAILQWSPAYLMRVQHMPLTEVAKWFGPAVGLTMGVGIFAGGALVNWLGMRSAKAYAWVPALSVVVTGLGYAYALQQDSWQATLIALLLPMVACVMYVAPALALVQNLTPFPVRSTATSIVLLGFNLLGVGLGPWAVGAASDAMKASGAAQPLQTALMTLAPAAVVCALIYLAILLVIDRDSAAIRKEHF